MKRTLEDSHTIKIRCSPSPTAALPSPNPSLPSQGAAGDPQTPLPSVLHSPAAKANSPLLTPPSCLWRLWHFPLQHFQAPVAPQPRQLRHSHGRANSNTRRLRSSPRQSLSGGRAAAAGASLASGCPPRPHTRQTHKLTPQSSSSGGAECSAQGSAAPDWGTNTTMAQLWKTTPGPAAKQRIKNRLTTVPGIPFTE